MNDDVTPGARPVWGAPRRVAFVAHCLVNQNAKVQEFARSPGVVPGVVERMRRHGYRIQQLPCPEMAFAGVVGLDGSPSSGVRYTGMARSWGGRPHFEDDDHEVVEGMGVWMEELRKGSGVSRGRARVGCCSTPPTGMRPATFRDVSTNSTSSSLVGA
jgi:hypothetical protein